MSSTDFTQFVMTEKSATATYHELVDAAIDEYGHDGYNGTISTTDFCGEIDTETVSIAEAEVLMNKHFQDMNKWNCYAIPIFANDSNKTRQVTVSITLAENEDFNTVLQAAIRLKKNEYISNSYNRIVSSTSSVVTTAAKEKTVTKYFIARKDNAPKIDWDKGFNSQAAARAHMVSFVKDIDNRDTYEVHQSLEYEVFGIVRRESGAALVNTKRHVKKTTYKVTATIETVVPAKRAGWAFYGRAGS